MKTFTDQLEAALMQQLQAIDHEHDNAMLRLEASIHCTLDIIEQLKAFILKYRFKNRAEEIEFFKHVKPRFLSRLISQHLLFRIESRKPISNDKAIKKYLLHEVNSLKKAFQQNIEFNAYYRTNCNHLDDKYFIRHQFDVKLQADWSYFDADRRFSTTHDHKVATLLAHDAVMNCLERQLKGLTDHDDMTKELSRPKHVLEWTESKSALVELIYALHYQGAVEASKAGIKELAACFESLFQIELGDYYRTFTDIKMRKTGRAKFLEALRDNLIRKMDDLESRY